MRVLVLAAFMLIPIGCTQIKSEGEINGYTYSIGSEVSYTELKGVSGYYMLENDDEGTFTYVITSGNMGEGDAIKITDLKMDDNNNLSIIVKTTHSKASEAPAVVTYPYCYLEISVKPNSVKITDEAGFEYNYIQEEESAS